MNDLTLIYISANLIDLTTSQRIRDYHFKIYTQYPVINITQGENYPVGGSSPYNYYKQMLEGCYRAHTEFVATCEDDTLYPTEHFTKRPSKGFNFAYNTNAWLSGVKTFWKSEPVMNSFGFYICDRLALIELLENRFRLCPTSESVYDEKHFHEPGVWKDDTPVSVDTFETKDPIIAFEHRGSLSGKRKRFGNPGISSLEPYGDAKALYNKYWN